MSGPEGGKLTNKKRGRERDRLQGFSACIRSHELLLGVRPAKTHTDVCLSRTTSWPESALNPVRQLCGHLIPNQSTSTPLQSPAAYTWRTYSPPWSHCGLSYGYDDSDDDYSWLLQRVWNNIASVYLWAFNVSECLRC